MCEKSKSFSDVLPFSLNVLYVDVLIMEQSRVSKSLEVPQIPLQVLCLTNSHILPVINPVVLWTPGIGKVFVEFDTPEQATAATRALNGRKFGGNVVMCFYFDEAKYAEKDFSD